MLNYKDFVENDLLENVVFHQYCIVCILGLEYLIYNTYIFSEISNSQFLYYEKRYFRNCYTTHNYTPFTQPWSKLSNRSNQF